ncbi:snakin-2-like [Silene latifolia]|uniref:snakin-2-like n=1 Tax=Silene latifolia TaxID=37657 RepID=UPI003D776BEF
MSTSKFVVASIFLSALVFQLVHAIPSQYPTIGSSNCTTYITPASGKVECGLACIARCCKSGRPNLCQRACGSCCGKCNCVPPGTSGNYHVCPCYASLTTRDNKPKCP